MSEIERTVEMLPRNMPDYAFKAAANNKCFDKDFIVYKSVYKSVVENYSEIKNKRVAKCRCTACEQTFIAEQIPAHMCCQPNAIGFYHPEDFSAVYTHNTVRCPCCGEGVEALHTSSIGRYTYHVADVYCATIHNINGHVAVLTWVVEKELDREGYVRYINRRHEGVVVIDKKAYRVTSVQRNIFGWSYFSNWTLRKRYDEQIGEVDRELIFCDDAESIYRTDSANCAIAEYIKASNAAYIGAYLRIWAKYPNVENLVKQGWTGILNSAIKKCYSISSYFYSNDYKSFSISKITNYLKLKKAKPHEILGVDKSELDFARTLNLDKLIFYRFAKEKQNIKLPFEVLQAAEEIGVFKLIELFKGDYGDFKPPIEKTINYLKKQRRTPQYLTDYLNMLQKVYNSMPPELIFPKNLIKSHDRLVELIKIEGNKAVSDKIHKIAEQHEYMSFADDETGLLIRPAADYKELIDEGKKLNHCVGTYAQSVADGKTLILFIRKQSEPDKPYFTLEFKNGIVSQNRGLKNCARTDDVIIFERHWLEYLMNLRKVKVKV